jgi:hypothetical protein
MLDEFLANFRELRHGEVRSILLLSTSVNKGKKRKGPSPIWLGPFRLTGLITRHHHHRRRGQAVAGGSDGCQYVR